MRALITGSRGFLGGYLRTELEQNGYEVVGINRSPAEGCLQCDLLDAGQTMATISQLKPDAVFHLAGQADVGKSWHIPAQTVEQNVVAAVNLMEAVRTNALNIPMVIVGSSDEYGNLGVAGVSVSETTPLRPQTPYAVSKKAQEEMASVYARAYGMRVCMTRSFNHAGPRQHAGFLISDFASGVVRVERGLAPSLRVGDLESRRDFTHVRDVARAYRLIAERGVPGRVYNVGSGRTVSAQEILDALLALAECPVPVEQDPARLRPSDTPVICCDHSLLTADTGWKPEIAIEQILRETLDYWRSQQ